MKTIAVVSNKGGSGKTTVSFNLAVSAYRRGRRTLLADTDPQRSASSAMKCRAAPGPECITAASGKLFQIQQAAIKGGVDLLVVDTPGGDEVAIADAIRIADLCLLISRPTYLDLAAALRTADLSAQLGRKAVVMLNQAPPRRRGVEPPIVGKALQALAVAKLCVGDTMLRARFAFQDSIDRGCGAEEWDQRGLAAAEAAALWDEVDQRLSQEPAVIRGGDRRGAVRGLVPA